MPCVGSGTTLRLDLSDGRLWNGGQEVALTPTSFSMLRYFVLHPNRLITKQELLKQVWPETHVSEDLVKDYVRRIRRVLGDDPAEPAFIETARGRGYRFVGDIAVSGAGNAEQSLSPARGSPPSIAVLPFADKSDGADQEYFSDGIAEGIIAELSRFRSLVVIARDSSFLFGAQPAAIDRLARELDAQYVLRGSVRKAGDRVRIHAQLIEAASGAYIWAEHYDRELKDIFSLQDEVSGAIVSTLVGRLEAFGRQRVARKGPDNLMAYEYLLLGDQHLRQGSMEGVLKARQMFQRAIDLEPTNARAHAEMAFSYLNEFWSVWTTAPEAAVDRAFALASKAVAMDELDSRAHIYLAAAYHYGKSNFELAEVEYNKAFELNPNDYDFYCLRSWLLALSGRAEEGIACAEQAIRLSPLTTEDCRAAQFCAAYTVRRYDEAVTALGSIVEPTNEVNAYLAMCYAQLARDVEARRAITGYIAVAREEMGDFPGEDGERWRQYWTRRFPFKHAEDLEHLLEGLHKAGLALTPGSQMRDGVRTSPNGL